MKLVTVLIVLTSLAVASAAEGKGSSKAKGQGKSKGNVVQTEIHARVAVYSTHDREIIRHHYHGSKGNLPPGLAKRSGSLPPGLEKQLRKNGRLPPGLQKRISPFPIKLEKRLPRLKQGLQRGFIEGRAVIYNPKTRVIVDVFAVF